ncbi:MAG TPA: cupin domain-containing protein [Solirubrobacteraceae bacterium]|nr:cupin domain-containing protein [Solirubrobacteraceae bacterium]
MRKFDNTTADSYTVASVEVTRWEQFGLGELMPFNAMWYVVPPGDSSPVDCHPERELSLVVSGRAVVHAAGRRTEVRQGGAFLLDVDEDHMVVNPSADEPLVVFSAYWMAAEDAPIAPAEQVAHA